MNNFRLNKKDFEFEEPSLGHRHRFENKLNENKLKTRKRRIIRPLLASGLVASITIITILFFNKQTFTDTNHPNTNICYNLELQDLKYYYTSQESKRISEIKSYSIDSNLYQSEVMQLDSMITNLCKELKTAPNDERIIDAAVLHYQMKIKTLDHILTQLKNINHITKKKNEEINL